ncbi:MAG TPA: hypothetical protein VHB98_02375, partial [Chloroflexota bacterium]|nr:hypothetical protein [Chloroflexota bacterium]
LRIEDQSLRGQGQSLTPEDQQVMAEGARLIPDGQQPTLAAHELTPSEAAADPRTEKEPLVQHQQKDTFRQQTGHAAVPASLKRQPDAVPVQLVQRASSAPLSQTALIDRLIEEGIAPGRARALAHAYPAERILQQLTWIDARSYQNRTATLIAAIERDYAAPASQRGAPSASTAFDGAKFYRGVYAICPHCGSRPCSCIAPQAARSARG